MLKGHKYNIHDSTGCVYCMAGKAQTPRPCCEQVVTTKQEKIVKSLNFEGGGVTCLSSFVVGGPCKKMLTEDQYNIIWTLTRDFFSPTCS
jgi:hypothetical protein